VSASHPLTLGRAWDVFDRVSSSVRAAIPAIRSLEAAGDMRRTEPLVSTIVLVLQSSHVAATMDALASVPELTIVERSQTRVTGHYARTPIEIHVAEDADLGTLLFRATGSDAHVSAITARGLPSKPFSSEEELYASVGLPFIYPELRDNSGEIEAAANGSLPPLVQVADIRGDLHMHSTYSDGRDTVDAMIEGCRALGYEYMAITDHSFSSAASRTLDLDGVERQRDEVARLRETFPDIAILHGVEVDIMPDGRLDFDDGVLERFDLVLAWLPDRARHAAARLTQRSLAAIRHPLVNILCHPANRMVGSSAGYELDFDALHRAARETGTALEVDGAPMHLDFDGEHARAAAAAGATLAIDSDCHKVEALGRQMRLGVGTARRGWVESRHVLNTRSLSEVRAFIAAKRNGR